MNRLFLRLYVQGVSTPWGRCLCTYAGGAFSINNRVFKLALSLSFFLVVIGGCAGLGSQRVAAPLANPVMVAHCNHDSIWERTVDVLHGFQFQIDREDRLDGLIETKYKTGSSIFEPWHLETVGFHNRMESTLQSIRRRVFVRIWPDEGGHLVTVEAFRELEDLPGLAANSPGGATFKENTPLQRDLNLVTGQTAPSGWIAQGRDLDLEQALLARLNAAYAR